MKPSERVQAALDAAGLKVRVVEFAASTATAPEAAAAAGCPLGAIVKSLLFLVDGDPVLILVAGDRSADTRKIAAICNVGRKRVKMADAATVRRLTGYEIGGVPPLGHPAKLRTFVDDSLRRFDTVWAAAGQGNAVFSIAYARLVEITDGRAAAVTS